MKINFGTTLASENHMKHSYSYKILLQYYIQSGEQKNTKEEEVSEKATITNDLQFEKDVEPSIHNGPEVRCDNIDTVTTNNSFDCVCCVCTKKVELINR